LADNRVFNVLAKSSSVYLSLPYPFRSEKIAEAASSKLNLHTFRSATTSIIWFIGHYHLHHIATTSIILPPPPSCRHNLRHVGHHLCHIAITSSNSFSITLLCFNLFYLTRDLMQCDTQLLQ